MSYQVIEHDFEPSSVYNSGVDSLVKASGCFVTLS